MAMARAYGIVTPAGGHIKVEGMDEFRPISAFSFLGRYRIVDFPVSSMSNSGIGRIQVYVSQNPRSLAEHLGSGRVYNINSKRGKLQLLFNQDSRVNEIYNTDIKAYLDNMDVIERMHQPYVVISPGHMVFVQDYHKLLEEHLSSGADVTIMYHKVNDADVEYRNCSVVNLNRQKGVKSIEQNTGTIAERNIFMDTYVMSNELFIKLVHKAHDISSVYRQVDIINAENESLDIRGVQHKGFFATITDFKSYYDTNMSLLDWNLSQNLFRDEWPIYTQTTDSCPSRYTMDSSVKNSMVANGSLIEGTVENSILGRGVHIKKGAVVRNCMILSHAIIEEGVHVENQVVDKWAQIKNIKELVTTPDKPGYVRRNDIL